MKKLIVETPISVYKNVKFEVCVPEDVNVKDVEECILRNGYNAFVCVSCKALEKCTYEEIGDEIIDVVINEMCEDKIYDAGQCSEEELEKEEEEKERDIQRLIEFTKDVGTMSYDHEYSYVIRRVPGGAVMVTDNAIYMAHKEGDYISVEQLKKIEGSNK